MRKGVNRINDVPPVLTGYDREGNPVRIVTKNLNGRGLLVLIPAKPLPWFGRFLEEVKAISESEKVAITIVMIKSWERTVEIYTRRFLDAQTTQAQKDMSVCSFGEGPSPYSGERVTAINISAS